MQAWCLKALCVVIIPHSHLTNSLLNWASVMPGYVLESRHSSNSPCVNTLLADVVGASMVGIEAELMSILCPQLKDEADELTTYQVGHMFFSRASIHLRRVAR
jgi:hypothetical protein